MAIRKLSALLLSLWCSGALAQQLVLCAPSIFCNPNSGPSATGTGDPSWVAFGKINVDLTALYTALQFNMTGDVTVVAGTSIANITPGAVTNGDLAQTPANTIKCNPTGASGPVLDCTTAQVNAMLGGGGGGGGPLIPGGSTFTASGCLASTFVAGANAVSFIAGGEFILGTGGPCSVVINLPTATHGWACHVSDLTSPTLFVQTARSTTSCTVSAPVVAGDRISFIALGY